MKAPGGKFGRKKEEAIAALFTQRNIEEAAKTAGIGANTLLRWLKIPEFQASYREARRAAFGQAVARLQQGTSAAATTMLKTLVDPGTPASVKVRAAEAIFNHAAKAIDRGYRGQGLGVGARSGSAEKKVMRSLLTPSEASGERPNRPTPAPV